ncbi:MAG: M23 family metallopeptidase, partial [DPANN group archaeon]|nr:M23 family metallopeptidase [DPANN group archaeon]
ADYGVCDPKVYHDQCDIDTKLQGIDLDTPVGTPVYAPFDGTVEQVGCHIMTNPNLPRGWGFGERISIKSSDGTLYATFGHLKTTELKLNRTTRIKAGTLLGYAGSTMGCFLGCTNRDKLCVGRCKDRCIKAFPSSDDASINKENKLLREQCTADACGIPGAVEPHLHFELKERDGRSWAPVNPKEALQKSQDLAP